MNTIHAVRLSAAAFLWHFVDRLRAGVRPRALIRDGRVLCGHCGSSDTCYLETVQHYARFAVGSTTGLQVDTTSFFAHDEGEDPRVYWCECGRSSVCPPFGWR